MSATPRYVGNGPYCFTNSLVMMLGADAPPTAAVETLTGSPFGFQLLVGRLPLFDPFGWNPDLGLDQAIGLLGYEAKRATHTTAQEALAGLRDSLVDGPVLVGPLDMGLLAHQPESDRASGADHFVVVIAADEKTVVFHDPQGHPYATLPTSVFLAAWRGEQIGYLDAPYAMRTDMRRVRVITETEALRGLLPLAREWTQGRDLPTPPGTLGGADGYHALAALVRNPEPDLLSMLAHFSIRVGARRRGDAAHCLRSIGHPEAASCLEAQAVELGRLQYASVVGDGVALTAGCVRLAELHEDLLRLLDCSPRDAAVTN